MPTTGVRLELMSTGLFLNDCEFALPPVYAGPTTLNYSCRVDWRDPEAPDIVRLRSRLIFGEERGVSSSELTQTVRQSQSITFAPGLAGKVGDTLALSATGGASANPVTFSSLTPQVCAVEDSATLKLNAARTCTVKASQAGNADYEAAEATRNFTVAKGDQLPPAFSALTRKVGDSDVLQRKLGNGTGDVNWSVESGQDYCEIDGTSLTFKAAGSCTVTGFNPGDENYSPGTVVSYTITVTTAPQPPLSFTPQSQLVFGEQITLQATGGSGTGKVTYAIISGGAFCSITDDKLEAIKAGGSCTVEATKAGDGSYDAVSATAEVKVSARQSQPELKVISSGPLSFPGSVTLSVTGGRTGGNVTYRLLSGPCALAGAVLSSTGPGTCTVQATMAGDGGYLDVTSAPLAITVSRNLAVEEAERRMQQAMVNTGRAMLSFNPAANRPLGGQQAGAPVAFLPQGDSTQGSIAFAGSLQQIANGAGKGDRVVPTSATRPDAPPDAITRAAGSLDVWADGRFVWFEGEDDGGRQNGFLGEAGIDYLVQENLLIGVSLRFDDVSGDEASGHGWMAGPYAVFEVVPGLRLDAKLQYGLGDGEVDFGLGSQHFKGDYETTRWLAEAGARGEIDLSPVTIEPGIRASWWQESADSYQLDDNAGTVPEQDLTLLRLALDPRLSYQGEVGDGLSAGPYFQPQLIAEWQDQTGEDAAWDVFGALEAGLAISGPTFSFGTRVELSGLGADEGYAFAAGADLSIPLN